MAAEIISGKEVAKAIRAELTEEVAELKAKHGLVPGLATVLVGEDPASVSYVTAKGKACTQIGVNSFQHKLSADTSEEELLKLVKVLLDYNLLQELLIYWLKILSFLKLDNMQMMF